ncbi:hypothetical protein Bbelb_254250 [Branchiostoma belcheri]|nr:hypothetical protein Bbelb_254250 [Branchiostoma belcheri]
MWQSVFVLRMFEKTKVTTEKSIALRHGHLQLLGQEQGYHGRVGIWVCRRLMKGIQGYKQFGDRRIKQRRTVTQARAYHVPEISTVHRMVVATICLPQKVWFSNTSTRTKAIRLDEIRNDKDKQEEWKEDTRHGTAEGKCNTSKRVRELVTARLHAQAAKIEVIKDDNARTFSAMKDLRFSGGDPLAVRSSSGETLVKPLHLANIISKRFESLFKFNIDAAPLPPFQTAPLRKPVKASEVARAASRLKNGRRNF